MVFKNKQTNQKKNTPLQMIATNLAGYVEKFNRRANICQCHAVGLLREGGKLTKNKTGGKKKGKKKKVKRVTQGGLHIHTSILKVRLAAGDKHSSSSSSW